MVFFIQFRGFVVFPMIKEPNRDSFFISSSTSVHMVNKTFLLWYCHIAHTEDEKRKQKKEQKDTKNAMLYRVSSQGTF